MSSGNPTATVNVTVADGSVTIDPATLVVAIPPTSSIDITWNITGGTFYSLAWGGGQVQTTSPTVGSTTFTYTFTPQAPAEQVAQSLYVNYTITVNGASGLTANAQIQIASSWAYPDSYSVNPGDDLVLHVASTAPYTGVKVWPATWWVYEVQTDGTPYWTEPGQQLGSGSPLVSVGPVPIEFSTLAPNNGDPPNGGQDWNWPVPMDPSGTKPSLPVTIPAGTATGLYIAEVAAYNTQDLTDPHGNPTPKISMTWVMFVVKNPSPKPGTSFLYKWNINTIQGYSQDLSPSIQNSAGSWESWDNDLYYNPYPPAPQTPPPVPYQITFHRPTSQEWDYKSMTYDFGFIQWLTAQNLIDVDFCTDVDVETDTDLTMLSNYACVIFRGHDEYLGSQTYQNLINYRNAGGNIAFLSGNTCCWQVHYVYDENNVAVGFTCNKGLSWQALDVVGPDAWWLQGGPGGLDNQLVGAGSRNAGIFGGLWATNPYYGAASTPPPPPPSPGYTVQNTDHWIFTNTNLTDGYTIGLKDLSNESGSVNEVLIGYENNGARLNDDGTQLTYTDGTPANFALLGVAETTPVTASPSWNGQPGWLVFSRENGPVEWPSEPAGYYAATMGMYSAYGSVFTASSINWVLILNEVNYADGGALGQSYSPTSVISPSTGSFVSFPGLNDVNGNPILGNPYVHYITLNVLTAFSTLQRNVVAVADLNGDGSPDLLLQSAGTGEPSYWLLDGTAQTAANSILYDGSGAPGLTWRIAGVASLTTPTSTEIILQNSATGALWYWTIDATLTRTASAALVPVDVPGAAWKLSAILSPPAGTAGATLIFQNQVNGSLYYWQLNGTLQSASGDFVSSFAPGNLDQILVGAVDLNGDGNQELIFQAGPAGALTYWTLNGLDQDTTGSITGPAAPGNVVGGAAFTSGSPAILFQDTSGNLTYWTISNYAENGTGTFTPGSNPNFLQEAQG